ncbi:hypothetical protein KIPB_012138, partial [Kipferlia bialata]
LYRPASAQEHVGQARLLVWMEPTPPPVVDRSPSPATLRTMYRPTYDADVPAYPSIGSVGTSSLPLPPAQYAAPDSRPFMQSRPSGESEREIQAVLGHSDGGYMEREREREREDSEGDLDSSVVIETAMQINNEMAMLTRQLEVVMAGGERGIKAERWREGEREASPAQQRLDRSLTPKPPLPSHSVSRSPSPSTHSSTHSSAHSSATPSRSGTPGTSREREREARGQSLSGSSGSGSSKGSSSVQSSTSGTSGTSVSTSQREASPTPSFTPSAAGYSRMSGSHSSLPPKDPVPS